MRFLSKAEWFVVAVVVAIVIALVAPAPHWRETASESCHLCGNCRTMVRQFRWWQLDSETVEPTAVFPVPARHEHAWWQYQSSCVSCNGHWAASKASRYRDGSFTWAP